jgi:hypothetical protein
VVLVRDIDFLRVGVVRRLVVEHDVAAQYADPGRCYTQPWSSGETSATRNNSTCRVLVVFGEPVDVDAQWAA